MKKLSLVFAVMFVMILGLGCFKTFFTQADSGWASVIVSRCYLYEEADFSSKKVTYEKDEETILIVLNHGDKVYIKGEGETFSLVETINGQSGYIYKYYISSNSSQSVYPVFNASIRKDTIIYDINKEATEFTAKKGSRVYIYEGFNDKKKFTAVQIVLEDESLYNGYILTADIAPDGVSGLLIAAITIIIAAVTIILSLLFIKKKKKKKKTKKEKEKINV